MFPCNIFFKNLFTKVTRRPVAFKTKHCNATFMIYMQVYVCFLKPIWVFSYSNCSNKGFGYLFRFIERTCDYCILDANYCYLRWLVVGIVHFSYYAICIFFISNKSHISNKGHIFMLFSYYSTLDSHIEVENVFAETLRIRELSFCR